MEWSYLSERLFAHAQRAFIEDCIRISMVMNNLVLSAETHLRQRTACVHSKLPRWDKSRAWHTCQWVAFRALFALLAQISHPHTEDVPLSKLLHGYDSFRCFCRDLLAGFSTANSHLDGDAQSATAAVPPSHHSPGKNEMTPSKC